MRDKSAEGMGIRWTAPLGILFLRVADDDQCQNGSDQWENPDENQPQWE